MCCCDNWIDGQVLEELHQEYTEKLNKVSSQLSRAKSAIIIGSMMLRWESRTKQEVRDFLRGQLAEL